MIPRWLVPLVVLCDLAVVGLLYAVLGWFGLLFAVPVLIGSVIALVVLRVTAPVRRAVADLRVPARPMSYASADTGSWWVPNHDSPTATGWSGGESWSGSWSGDTGSADCGSWGSGSSSDSGSSCSSDSGSSSSDSGSSSSSD
ncbi:hypothetical protein [Pseudonocardia pini]|uniref:hypothetical protein n=1 Tax=Pseudonocardia pini TaxID=2758030 RepID=UPI0015EFE6E8|nr:hypothetical protein [Pseudonocardia pini]